MRSIPAQIHPPGIEPGPSAPETDVISILLWVPWIEAIEKNRPGSGAGKMGLSVPIRK